MARRPVRLACLFVAALAGCGKDDPPAGGGGSGASGARATAGSTQDACELVTREEAAAALGRPVKEPKSDSNPAIGQRLCVFEPEVLAAKLVQITLVQTRGMPAGTRRGTPDAAALFRNTRASFTDAKPVAGLGDEAFSSGLGVHVLEGDSYLTVLVGTIGASDAKAEEDLARKALARLK